MITLFAHALVQREDIPLPPVVFAWAAAAVLVISFVGLAALWPAPRLQQVVWRPKVSLPGALDALGGAIGVTLLALVIWAGFAGEQSAATNVAPIFVYSVFWVGMPVVSVLFGDVFRVLSPWRALGRLLHLRGRREYRLGNWPAALGLLFFTWTELVGLYGNEPDRVALCAVLYTLFTLGGMALYGTDTWANRAEAFGVYFGLFARISVFERRDGRLGLRPLLSGLPRVEAIRGTVALVAVMIGTVTFDGFTRSGTWSTGIGKALNELFDGPFGAVNASYIAGTIGLVGCVLLVGGFYRLGIAGAESVGGGISAERLRGAFVHSLVPIALAYVLAHYFSFLLSGAQSTYQLASDPLGHGWNLFGTIDTTVRYLNGKITWYFQVAFVVIGHVAGLVLAHDRALAMYDDQQAAVRSQYWMLSVMVGFTSLALYLLSQSNS